MTILPNIPVRTLEEVYFSTVRASVLYGSELRGWELTRELDSKRGMFLKRILLVRKGTCNQGIKREFGIFSDIIVGKIIMLIYWLDIIKGSQGTLRAMYSTMSNSANIRTSADYWLISLK